MSVAEILEERRIKSGKTLGLKAVRIIDFVKSIQLPVLKGYIFYYTRM